MNFESIIVVVIIIILFVSALFYLIKNRNHCLGCPYSKDCIKYKDNK